MRPRPFATNPIPYKATRVHHVILVTSGAGTFCVDGSLDRLIKDVLNMKKNPILVLGPEGDDILLNSRQAEACDLAYDPNYAGELFSGIHAGLHAATGPAFIFPLTRLVQDRANWENEPLWKALEKETVRLEGSHQMDILVPPVSVAESKLNTPSATQAMTQSITSRGMSFPQAVSTLGAHRLLQLPTQTPWGHPEQMKLQALSPEDLATEVSDSVSDRTSGQAVSF